MAKSQSTKSAKGSTSEKVARNGVKAGRVTKATETPKAKSKEMAKAAAKATKKGIKVKAPSPSDSEDSDSSDDSSSNSESEADSESEAEAKPASKLNGASKKAVHGDSSSDSESEADSDDEQVATPAQPAKVNGSAKPTNGVSKTSGQEEDSSSDDSSDESEKESDEDNAEPKANGKTNKVMGEVKKADKSNNSSDNDEDSDVSSSDSSDDEEEVVKKTEATKEEASSKKRKAETAVATPAKKTKGGNPPSKNLFVGNLSWNVDEEWLRREFEEFGELSGCRIVTDRDSGRSRGFGYIEFVEVDAAVKALEEKHDSDLDGRPLNIDYASPRPEQSPFQKRDRADQRAEKFGDRPAAAPSETLFVGNLSFEATNDAVSEEFSKFGTLTRVSLPTDPDSGAIKGFAYVAFSSIDEAKAAMEGMRGQDILGRPCRLDYATPRAEGGGNRGGRGGFGGNRGGRGNFGGFGGRGGGRGGGGRDGGRGGRGGRGGSTNRGGFGDFKGSRVTF